jgi:DNA-binding NarL/FixJ family response regulator
VSAVRPIRVLVADDHPSFREGLVAILDDLDEVVVVGQAGTGEEAVTLAAVQPDVVLMDLHMPGIGRIAATEQLTASRPDVVVLTMVEDADAIVRAMRARARGYLLKEATRRRSCAASPRQWCHVGDSPG